MTLDHFPLDSIVTILQDQNIRTISDLPPGTTVQTTGGPGTDILNITRTDEKTVQVAHITPTPKETLRSPEVVFTRTCVGGDTHWLVAEFQYFGPTEEGADSGLTLQGFLEQWDRLLSAQGYTQRTTQSPPSAG